MGCSDSKSAETGGNSGNAPTNKPDDTSAAPAEQTHQSSDREQQYTSIADESIKQSNETEEDSKQIQSGGKKEAETEPSTEAPHPVTGAESSSDPSPSLEKADKDALQETSPTGTGATTKTETSASETTSDVQTLPQDSQSQTAAQDPASNSNGNVVTAGEKNETKLPETKDNKEEPAPAADDAPAASDPAPE